MTPWSRSGVLLCVAALAACGLQPPKPMPAHMREEPRVDGTIPPPVQIAPVLPKPTPAVRPETYSVVVNGVRVQELLFALARDARLNIDIHPEISGTVTLNAIDQTLPQLLARIARQVDMRYEIDGNNLFVMRDTPVLRAYKIDYVAATRNVKMQSTASTQFGSTATAGATGASASIDVLAENKLWESVVQNVKEILRETDKMIPGGAPAAPPPVSPPGTQPAATPPQPTSTYQEAAAVIGNRESGVLYVRATAKQHEKVQEFLDQVMAGAKRQVLIEATVAEVQLRNEYQRGIEWQRLRSGSNGTFEVIQPGSLRSPPSGLNLNPLTIGYISSSGNFSATLKLLEEFGSVKVVSSPKLSVLNNQTAILRVTRDIIYFTITPATTSVSAAGSGTVVTSPTFTTTPNVAAEGFMMSVLPQVNENDAVLLNIRPTIRRQVGSVRDPNPALRGRDPVTNLEFPQNEIPLFETREFDSILRMQSAEIAVLAGLMQDTTDNREIGIPGVRSVPILGEALSQRADLTTKTELVIFLRATVIRDPSIDGDFRGFRDQMPREDFFRKPNPGQVGGPMLPRPLQ